MEPQTTAESTQDGRTTADIEKGTQAHTNQRRGFLNQLPTWSEFWRNEWRDLLPMFIATIITLPLNASPPIGKRLFPVPTLPKALSQSSSSPSPDPNSILWAAYPSRDQIITVPLSACLAIFPPLVLFTVAQVRLRSYPDLHASWYGLLSTLVVGTFFQVVLKSFVGGLRPYFYDACQPNMVALSGGGGKGWGGVMYGREICTGAPRDVDKALTSFPSGHSNAAMGCALFVSLWLNAKLKVFADSRARFWKLFLFFFPLVFAATICGSLSLDESHNWYDILVGATIGVLSALASYRTRYAAIWDFRFNHIPLPRSTFKVIADDLQHDIPSLPENPEKQTVAENPPRSDAPVLPPMTLLAPVTEESLPATPAPSSVNDTMNAKSMDRHMNAHVGEMDTVIEEGGVGNAETQPEEHPERRFRFRKRKGSSVLKREKERREKPKFIKYSQRFTYDLGLLAAVERAGGFDNLYQQIHNYFHHIQDSNQIPDTLEEPDNSRPVARTPTHRDGLHRASGTEVSHRQSGAMRDSRPYSFQTAPTGASTSEATQLHSPPALAASTSDRAHPTQSSNLNTTAEWSFVERRLRSSTYAGSHIAEGVHESHNWLAPARGSMPQSPYLPVLTRRWMGSATGREGDAVWSRNGYCSSIDDREARKGLRGGLGLAHEEREYGRE